MFKLDKSNQKQIADMLHDLVEQLEGSGFDLSYLEVAANIVRLYDININNYWSLERFVTVQGEPEITIDESDIEGEDIAEDGIACEWCCAIIKHGEKAYRANDAQGSIVCEDCYE